MTPAQLHILQHTLGLDEHGRGTMWRNYFVTGEGSTDHPHCVALVDLGYMARRSGNELSGGDDVFWATEEGKSAVVRESPPPPKLSRSKQRYQDYLDADSSMAFGEWLKARFGRRNADRRAA